MLKFTANLSLLFTEADLIDRFKSAKQQGFNGVEIQFPYHLNAESIRAALQDNGLKLILFNVDADDLLQGGEGLACVPEKRTQFRAAVNQALAYAQILKPDVINVLPGRCVAQNSLPAYLDCFKENLRFAAGEFAALGVKTVFEAINTLDMPGFIIHSGQQMLDVLEQLNCADLLMQYDCYHLYRMGENPVEFIARHADKMGHIQFADCPGRGQPGTGQINFDALFLSIEQSAYTGWVGAEYKPIGRSDESLGWFHRRLGMSIK